MNIRLIIFFIVGIIPIMAENPPVYPATVTNTNDNGAGSLRVAIASAPSREIINFALQGCPCTITLTSGQLFINKSLTIIGPSADQLTISGNNQSRVFWVDEAPHEKVNVVLDSLRIADGRPVSQGGPPPHGGGIWNNHANLTVRNSVVSNNAAWSGGGIYNASGSLSVINSTISDNLSSDGFTFNAASGGGINNDFFAELRIINSTISNNQAGLGGGIMSTVSTAQINNSTIEGNLAHNLGGGIYNNNSSMKVENCTLSGNISAETSAGGILNLGHDSSPNEPVSADLSISNSTITGNAGSGQYGTGIMQWGDSTTRTMTTLKNTMVAANTSGIPDIGNRNQFSNFVSSGYNLIGIAGSITNFNQPGDLAGSTISPIDPKLEPLAFNGGTTRTHALKLNSPAADKGNSASFQTDQRGSRRPNDNPDLSNAPGGDGSDIGAFEIQFPVTGTVGVGGRVLTSSGMPVRHGMVTMTDSGMNIRYASINPFGYYRFNDVPLGRAFSFSVKVKRFSQSAQVVFITESLTQLNFITESFDAGQ